MAISGVGSADATTTTTAASPSKQMDKDAFLKLLVAQISHQDPLKPMEGTEFVTQLSQFSMVEQAVAQSGKLDAIATQMSGLLNNEATALVGKTVTVRGHGIAYDGVTATGAAVTLGGPATKVTATIKDSSGAVVRTIDLGAKGAGALGVTWDGKNDAGVTQPKGAYSLEVKATAADGTDVAVTQDVSGRVVSVSFDKGYPEMTLDSGAKAPVSDLVSVDGAAATVGSTATK